MVFDMTDFEVVQSFLDSCGGDLEQELELFHGNSEHFISVAELPGCPFDLKLRIANLIGLSSIF